MRAAYRIFRPFNISFSGGRTSAFMLKQVIDAYGGQLPEDCPVLFANTGKERDETLDFVHMCAEHWNLKIKWLEYAGAGSFREVTYQTAHRRDQPNSPFEILIGEMKVLPNVVARYCTKLLKIKVMRDYLEQRFGWDKDFQRSTAIGIRADEAHRTIQIEADCPKFIRPVFPLVARGVTEKSVMTFWKKQGFDLHLRQYEGNCDLCFLKSLPKLVDLIRANPASADWWNEMEKVKPAEMNAGAKFHISRTYAGLAELARGGELFSVNDIEEDTPCGCGTGVGDWSDVGE